MSTKNKKNERLRRRCFAIKTTTSLLDLENLFSSSFRSKNKNLSFVSKSKKTAEKEGSFLTGLVADCASKVKNYCSLPFYFQPRNKRKAANVPPAAKQQQRQRLFPSKRRRCCREAQTRAARGLLERGSRPGRRRPSHPESSSSGSRSRSTSLDASFPAAPSGATAAAAAALGSFRHRARRPARSLPGAPFLLLTRRPSPPAPTGARRPPPQPLLVLALR